MAQAERDLDFARTTARVLDGYYIPTRYANGHDGGAPFSHYTELQSEQAIEYAGVLIDFARARMAGSR